MLDLRSSVYARAILFMVVVSLALLGLDLKQSWTARDARLQEAKTETNNLVGSLAQHAQDVFETTDALVKGLSEFITAEGTDSDALRRLERRMHARVTNQQLLYCAILNWTSTATGSPAHSPARYSTRSAT